MWRIYPAYSRMHLPIAHHKSENALNLTLRKKYWITAERNTGPTSPSLEPHPSCPNVARQSYLRQPPLTNVVYMGMGEPLDNPFAVTRSLEVLTHPHTFAMAKSKISVSTVGPSPGAVRRMKGMPSRLAWSVHAATDEVRRLLVPTTMHTMTELR